MSDYLPSPTNFPNGIVTITSSDGTPYYQIQNSIVQVRYFLNWLYVQASSNNQLLQPIEFYKYDANGNIQKFTEVTLIDLYQFQPALNIDMTNKNVVFDGNMFAIAKILPNETIFLRFDVTEKQNSDFIPKLDFISNNDFFKNLNG